MTAAKNPNARVRRSVTCADCGEYRVHAGRGLCNPCWKRRNNTGDLSQRPPLFNEPKIVPPRTVPAPFDPVAAKAAALRLAGAAIKQDALADLPTVLAAIGAPLADWVPAHV